MAVDVGRAGSSGRGARRRVSRLLLAALLAEGQRPAAAASRLDRRRLPRCSRHAAAVRLLLGRLVHRADQGRLDALELPEILSLDDTTYLRIAWHTIWIAAAVTVTDAVIAFPIAFYMARVASSRTRAVLFVMVLLPLWSSYIVRVYAWRVILKGGGRAELVAEPGRPAGRGHRLHGHGDVARLLVPVAAVHDPAALRGARARPGELPGGLARHGRARASGRSGASSCRSRCPGIVAGSIFTFSLTLGDYLTPLLIGGAGAQFIGNVDLRQRRRRQQRAVRGRATRWCRSSSWACT